MIGSVEPIGNRIQGVEPDEGERAADAGLAGKLINQNGDLFYFG